MRSDLVRMMLAQQRALRTLEEELETNDFSATETLLLAELHRTGPLTPTSLAQRVGLSRGRLSHLLNRLQGRGIVARRNDPRDGRSAQIAVAPEHVDAAADADQRAEALWGQIADLLGPGGEAMLLQQLGQVADIAEDD